MEFVQVGSKVDGLSVPRYHKRTASALEETTGLESDEDQMLVLHICPVGDGGELTTHLVMNTAHTMPGYVRLVHVTPPRATVCRRSYAYGIHKLDNKTGQLRTYFSFEQLRDERKYGEITDAGRMLLELVDAHALGMTSTISGPAFTTNIQVFCENIFRGNIDIDVAVALHSDKWPDTAKKWGERPRQFDWPSSTLIEKITEGGCYFVNVAHPQSSHPAIEWRFSFTVAERKLAHSFTTSQRQCYILLKIMVAYTTRPNTVVSSYCFKNVFFWKMEQIPQHVWNRIADGCFAVLDELIHCVAEKHLPHYFIPENNLLTSKPKESLSSTLRNLCSLRRMFLHKMLDFDLKHTLTTSDVSIITYLAYFLNKVKDTGSIRDFIADITGVYVARLRAYALNKDSEMFSYTLNEAVDDGHVFDSHEAVIQMCVSGMDADVDCADLLLGISWCALVHYQWLDTNILRLVWEKHTEVLDQYFKQAIDNAQGLHCRSNALLYYGIYLLHENRVYESRLLMERIEDQHRLDPITFDQYHITFEEYDAIVLGYSLEEELVCKKSKRIDYPLMIIVYHILAQSHSQCDDDDALLDETLAKYEAYCKDLSTSSSARCYGLLGQDLLGLNRYENALDAFRKQYVLCKSLQGVHNLAWVEQIEADINKCGAKIRSK